MHHVVIVWQFQWMNLVNVFLITNLQLLFFEHLMFQLLIANGNNNYYINWHIVSFRRFRCCCDIKTNKFSFEHVMHFNLPGAFSRSMFYIKINYTGITNMYISWFNKLDFSSWYKFCRFNYSNWHYSYLFFILLWQVSVEWPVLPQLV